MDAITELIVATFRKLSMRRCYKPVRMFYLRLPDLLSDITSTLTRASEARQFERRQVYLPLFGRAPNRVGVVSPRGQPLVTALTFDPPGRPARGPFPAYRGLVFNHVRAQLSDAQKITFDDMLRNEGLRQNGKNINVDLASHANNIRNVGSFRQRAISGPCDTRDGMPLEARPCRRTQDG